MYHCFFCFFLSGGGGGTIFPLSSKKIEVLLEIMDMFLVSEHLQTAKIPC